MGTELYSHRKNTDAKQEFFFFHTWEFKEMVRVRVDLALMEFRATKSTENLYADISEFQIKKEVPFPSSVFSNFLNAAPKIHGQLKIFETNDSSPNFTKIAFLPSDPTVDYWLDIKVDNSSKTFSAKVHYDKFDQSNWRPHNDSTFPSSLFNLFLHS